MTHSSHNWIPESLQSHVAALPIKEWSPFLYPLLLDCPQVLAWANTHDLKAPGLKSTRAMRSAPFLLLGTQLPPPYEEAQACILDDENHVI